MGYTHYFRYKPYDPAFREAWPQMVADAGRIVDRARAAGVVLVAAPGRPPVSTEGIWFTGSVDDELDGEPLVIIPDPDRVPPWRRAEDGTVQMSCKTGHFPYDVAVAAILLRCHRLAPEVFLINSDGDWDEEWTQDTAPPTGGLSARGLVAELFGDEETAMPFTPPA